MASLESLSVLPRFLDLQHQFQLQEGLLRAQKRKTFLELFFANESFLILDRAATLITVLFNYIGELTYPNPESTGVTITTVAINVLTFAMSEIIRKVSINLAFKASWSTFQPTQF